MVYDWAGKEEECYQWYVVDRRSLDDLMKHMKAKYGFEPSKRAYQTQFRRWNFPSKQSPAYQDAGLVERIRQLWEKNCGQKDMLRILKDEGWQIKERELLRVRTKHGWLLRGANGFQATFNKQRAGLKRSAQDQLEPEPEPNDTRQVDAIADQFDPVVDYSSTYGFGCVAADGFHHVDDASGAGTAAPAPRADAPVEDANVEARRHARHSELQEQSDELWAAKKRRRRTRGWAGLPADPPGPPRFPSETTLDESKAFLHLDNTQYQAVRDKFVQLCNDEGIVKKTQAGPEKWQAVKTRLINENPDLQREFYGPFNGVPQASKVLAVDVICMDVTKRLRTAEKRMTISEAKEVLALNPAQSRQIRSEFYDILQAEKFVSKLETGVDEFNTMKQRWLDSSALVQQVLSAPPHASAPADAPRKRKAFEVLSRDVMKRLRDDVTRADPTRKRQAAAGPGPGPAHPRLPPAHARPPPAVPARARRARRAQADEQQIDPSLVAAHDAELAQLQAYAAGASAGPVVVPPPPQQTQALQLAHPIAALFRLHGASTYPAAQKVWFGTLGSASIAEVVGVAGAAHGADVVVRKVEGLFAGAAGEMPFPIERDDEVAAYLQSITDGRVVFLVTLDRGLGGV